MPRNKIGAFFVVEGCDNVGKTTQVELLRDVDPKYFDSRRVKIIRFPDRTTASGVIIDSHLKGISKVDNIVELFAENRKEAIGHIRELKEAGYVVVCDRYLYSGIAYAVASDNTSDDATIMRNKRMYASYDATAMLPDDVFLLDGDPFSDNTSADGAFVEHSAEVGTAIGQEITNFAKDVNMGSWVAQVAVCVMTTMTRDKKCNSFSLIASADNKLMFVVVGCDTDTSLTAFKFNDICGGVANISWTWDRPGNIGMCFEQMMNAINDHPSIAGDISPDSCVFSSKQPEIFDVDHIQKRVRVELLAMATKGVSYWRPLGAQLGPLGDWLIIPASLPQSTIHEIISSRIATHFL